MTLDRLAVLGGSPEFAEPLHVGLPNLGDRAQLHARIDAALDRRWLTNDGPLVREFESRIIELVRVRHCIAVANATVGLEIAIRALGFTGEVLVPSFTFIATAHALQWLGIRPVFVEIDPATHNLDPHAVERKISPATTGILATHVWGRPCAIQALEDIAGRHHLPLLFDAAHAFGCGTEDGMIGNFGNAEVFSFHATKFVNCGEGGAIVTNDDALARRLRLMRNFGFAGYDRVESQGTNGKLSEFAAALGLTSLDAMPEIVAVNQQNFAAYRHHLSRIPGCTLASFDLKLPHNSQYIVVEVDPAQYGLTRDELVTVLHREGVLARKYFSPGCHAHEPYLSLYPDAGRELPLTEALCQRVLLLPNGQRVTPDVVMRVVDLIRHAAQQADDVRRALTLNPPD